MQFRNNFIPYTEYCSRLLNGKLNYNESIITLPSVASCNLATFLANFVATAFCLRQRVLEEPHLRDKQLVQANKHCAFHLAE